ncbi:hemerythrin domain-containing protein, partial [Mesorhizobium sp. M1E.F.Ca.ET.063.01.1.1]
MSDAADFSLLERAGLPDDLRWLTQKYPRETWQGHGNI